jgi:hypothetical protein
LKNPNRVLILQFMQQIQQLNGYLDIPFLADWNKIREHRQSQPDLNMEHENRSCHDWDYEVGDKVLLQKDGILHKSESWYESDPWTITSVHTNGTISAWNKIGMIKH